MFLSSIFTHMVPSEVLHYLDEIVRVLKPRGRCLATFFLLNDETRPCIESGTPAIDFPHALGEHRVRDREKPHTTIAYDEPGCAGPAGAPAFACARFRTATGREPRII